MFPEKTNVGAKSPTKNRRWRPSKKAPVLVVPPGNQQPVKTHFGKEFVTFMAVVTGSMLLPGGAMFAATGSSPDQTLEVAAILASGIVGPMAIFRGNRSVTSVVRSITYGRKIRTLNQQEGGPQLREGMAMPLGYTDQSDKIYAQLTVNERKKSFQVAYDHWSFNSYDKCWEKRTVGEQYFDDYQMAYQALLHAQQQAQYSASMADAVGARGLLHDIRALYFFKRGQTTCPTETNERVPFWNCQERYGRQYRVCLNLVAVQDQLRAKAVLYAERSEEITEFTRLFAVNEVQQALDYYNELIEKAEMLHQQSIKEDFAKFQQKHNQEIQLERSVFDKEQMALEAMKAQAYGASSN